MKSVLSEKFVSIEHIQQGFRNKSYICSKKIATTLYIAYHLEKPIIVEGPPGVGKTELAKTAAAFFEIPLIRIQCYEGIDEAKALYEWQYGKQLLYIQILKDKFKDVLGDSADLFESIEKLKNYNDIFFSRFFLEPRPLLKALQQKEGAVLLIDEVDKSDDEFEAFLFEILSDFQISIPEIGTVCAETKPIVFLTSNNTRQLSEPLKRRCVHLYIPLPDPELEMEIIRLKVPDISAKLQYQIVFFLQQIRELDIKKLPSISEAIDWAKVLLLLHADKLTKDLVSDTLNVILKFEEDIETVKGNIAQITKKIEEKARFIKI